MSIHLMSKVWRVKFPTHTQFLALMKCADFADDDGKNIYPSYQTIADNINASKRQVQYATEALEKVGLLVRSGQTSKGTIEWNINVPLLTALHEQQVFLSGKHDVIELVDKGGAIIAMQKLHPCNGQQLGWQSTTARVATDCHQSFKNHQEPSGASAGARENSRTAPLEKIGTRFKLTPDADRPQWKAWIDFLREQDREALVHTAEVQGHMTVVSKWPDKVGLRGLLDPKTADHTQRILGETAE